VSKIDPVIAVERDGDRYRVKMPGLDHWFEEGDLARIMEMFLHHKLQKEGLIKPSQTDSNE
jgi:hypothetical protein